MKPMGPGPGPMGPGPGPMASCSVLLYYYAFILYYYIIIKARTACADQEENPFFKNDLIFLN